MSNGWTPELAAAAEAGLRYQLPSWDEYALDHRCYRCKAEPGQACTIKGTKGQGRGYASKGANHGARLEAAWRHHQRDLGRMPWPEDRVPGTEYHTLRHVTRQGSGWPEDEAG